MITKTITTAPTTTSAVRSVAFLEARTPANLPGVWPGAGLEGGADLDSSVAMTVNLSHGVRLARPTLAWSVAHPESAGYATISTSRT
jgi:hypothetical protein